MKKPIDVYLPPLPANLAPTDMVRRWDMAGMYAALVFAFVFMLLGFILSTKLAAPEYPAYNIFYGWATWHSEFMEHGRQRPALFIAGLVNWLVALGLGAWAFIRMLKPYCHIRHISGFRLYEGKEAIEQATIQSMQLSAGKPRFLKLHPLLPLPKTMFTRHAFTYGSVGSGKSVILAQLIHQLISLNYRTMLWDIKGDWTQMFFQPKYKGVRLLCPWDARSMVWDIAKDCDSPDKARALADGFFPETGGDNDIFNQGSGAIFAWVVISLQREMGLKWGWEDLAKRLTWEQPQLHKLLEQYDPNTARMIADAASKSTSSMLMNLSARIRVIVDLAQAWPNSNTAERFSWREWATKKIKARQIIVQPGPSRQASSEFVAAMFNVITATIISPEMPDDEEGRTLAFVIDELTSIGRFELPSLIDKGRSKGCIVYCGMQDLAQLKKVYGEEDALAMTSMVGAHIVCQIQMGETRNKLAELFGYKRVAVTLPSVTKGQGTSVSINVRDESRAIIDATDLTEKLGARTGPQYPAGFAVRAIVSLGKDPLLLEWEGIKWPKPTKARVPAAWTLAPMKQETWRQLHGVDGPDRAERKEAAEMMVAAFAQIKRPPSNKPTSILSAWREKVGIECST